MKQILHCFIRESYEIVSLVEGFQSFAVVSNESVFCRHKLTPNNIWNYSFCVNAMFTIVQYGALPNLHTLCKTIRNKSRSDDDLISFYLRCKV